MEEIIAPTIGFVLGLWLWSSRIGRRPGVSLGLGVAIAAVAGLTATVVTGEFLESWTYVLVDIATGAAGVCAAMLVIRFLPPSLAAKLFRREV